MKVLLTATVQSHICQFHKPLVEVLHTHGCEVHVAARDNLAAKKWIEIRILSIKYIMYLFQDHPKSLDNMKAYKVLKEIIQKENYDVIHCNTPMGGIVTRLAAEKQERMEQKCIHSTWLPIFIKVHQRKTGLYFIL